MCCLIHSLLKLDTIDLNRYFNFFFQQNRREKIYSKTSAQTTKNVQTKLPFTSLQIVIDLIKTNHRNHSIIFRQFALCPKLKR